MRGGIDDLALAFNYVYTERLAIGEDLENFSVERENISDSINQRAD